MFLGKILVEFLHDFAEFPTGDNTIKGGEEQPLEILQNVVLEVQKQCSGNPPSMHFVQLRKKKEECSEFASVK